MPFFSFLPLFPSRFSLTNLSFGFSFLSFFCFVVPYFHSSPFPPSYLILSYLLLPSNYPHASRPPLLFSFSFHCPRFPLTSLLSFPFPPYFFHFLFPFFNLFFTFLFSSLLFNSFLLSSLLFFSPLFFTFLSSSLLF